MAIIDLEPASFGMRVDRPEKAFVTPGAGDHGVIEPDDQLASETGLAPPEREKPSLAGAIWRTENMVASAMAVAGHSISQERDPDLKVWDEIKGTAYEPHWNSFTNVRNREQLRAVQGEIDRETEDRKAIAAAPWYQTVPLTLLANITDPTILAPGGAFVRGAKGGFSISRSAINVGLATGAGTAVQESVLMGTQHLRTGREAAIDISASVLLGGLLGAGGAKLMTRGEFARASANLERELLGQAPEISASVRTHPDLAPIYNDISDQLRIAKPDWMGDAEIDKYATLTAARYAARAERLGGKVSALDLYRAEGIELRGADAPETASGRSFNQSQPEAPTFFSAVARTVDAIPQAKASPDQWLSTIKNKAGVKPEEMEWLGLESWLKQQPGPVSKQELQDYIRANQIDVRDVEKGGGTVAELEREWDRAASAVKDAIARRLPDEEQNRLRNIRDDLRKQMRNAALQGGNTKFASYTLPGGENYRELLLTLPRSERDLQAEAHNARISGDHNAPTRAVQDTYRSPHFDEPNVLAHVRFNDRVIDGKRTLFLEEVQSDWHQKGKRDGYRGQAKTTRTVAEIDRDMDANLEELGRRPNYVDDDDAVVAANNWDRNPDLQARHDELWRERNAASGIQDGVPNAPFKTTWPELALKRMIRYAAENGYEKIAWTSGKIQAERYDLSKQIKEIRLHDNTSGGIGRPKLDGPIERAHLVAFDHQGREVISRGIDGPDDLPNIIGKEAADKLVQAEAREGKWAGLGVRVRSLSGLELQVGGEGMAGFYDKILPAAANKLVKKYGARVEQSSIPTEVQKPTAYRDFEEYADMRLAEKEGRLPPIQVHTLDITPELRKAAISDGFPLFQAGADGPRGRITLGSNKTIIDLFASADRSTFGHEMGHKWLDELASDAARTDVPQALKDDLGTVLRWLGVDKAEDLGKAQHEQWAKAFERYLAEGKAPSQGLARAFESFKQWLLTIYRGLTDIDATINDEIRSVMDRMLASDAEIGARQAGQGPSSLGSAANLPVPLGSTEIAGTTAAATAAATRRLNPGLRLLSSPSAAVRDVALNLAEHTRYLTGNQDGLATPIAAETLKKEWNAGLMQAARDSADAWSNYRKAGGALSRGEFNQEVGRAMRRNDEHEIPEVAKVASAWRKNVFDPLKDAAIEAKLLPEDVSVETAASYFSRMWNRKKLVAGEREFKSVVREWVLGMAPKWASDFDAETAAKLAKIKDEAKAKEFEIERRIERDSRFGVDGQVGDEIANDIANDVFNKLTGRTAAQSGQRPEFITVNARGPLKERTFNIPDELVEKWLENDIDIVGRRYHRIMAADVELARKFGSPDMRDQIAKVREDYAQLRKGVTDEKEILKLDKAERRDIADIEGVRDILRGTYAHGGHLGEESNFGRIVRVANAFNYIRLLGGVVLSSLGDVIRIPMVHGLTPFLRDGFKALRLSEGAKLAVREAQLAGNVVDRVLQHRLATLAEINDYYTTRGPVEKFMENLTNIASSWNGIVLWTDSMKAVASIVSQNRILNAARDFAKASEKDRRFLNFVGIDQSMAERIGKQFDKHGEMVDGVHVANAERWTDKQAIRAYRAALNKDTDSIIVTKGAADTPLIANTPLGRAIFQFSTFNLAAHQRVLLRGLQEDKARFVSGVIALTTLGMLQTYLRAVASNRADKLPSFTDNPGWWIAEGLDTSGVFSVFFQVANGVEKVSGFNPIKAPMKLGDQGSKGSDRMRNRNISSVAGPTPGAIEDFFTVAGIPATVWSGDDVKQGQKNAAERLIPFNSYLGVRQALKYLVNPPPD